jgi:Baseplate J-like protein
VTYDCCDDRRREALRERPAWNGIDFLEVVDDAGDPPSARQRTLLVHFVHPLAPGALDAPNVRIEGGERIAVRVVRAGAELASPPASPPGDPRVLAVEVDRPGDFSTYTLRLVDAQYPERPPPGFDPVLSRIAFGFKVLCPSDLDGERSASCPAPAPASPELPLAKDYATFRDLMLDRMAKLAPGWQERNAADLGVVLVELLASVGDGLSYLQDAVATEAYLATARLRSSVRRHARLVDYPMHDGRNARTWVRFEVEDGVRGARFGGDAAPAVLLTRTHRGERVLHAGTAEHRDALRASPQAFALMDEVALFADHNALRFHTWGASECCLPAGATRATLRGSHPDLAAGMALVLAEVKGARTGLPEDADPTRRVAVQLTSVAAAEDPLGGAFDPVPSDAPLPVTEIAWDAADALPFALCVSSREGAVAFDDVSVAYGNVALADHGQPVGPEELPAVPRPNPALAPAEPPAPHCAPRAPARLRARYRPALAQGPVTCAEPYRGGPASAALSGRSFEGVLPRVWLSDGGTRPWEAARDLLGSDGSTKAFVVETEDDGTARLRFGDGTNGQIPDGRTFEAHYRVGNGTAGNVGADALYHLVLPQGVADPGVLALENPLPASGGVDPEPLEAVRQRAPFAFRVQERAVTEDDYARMAQRQDPTLQRAAATFRWTGSWRTVFVTADRAGGAPVELAFRGELARRLERYRMVLHDVAVDAPALVPLAVELEVCVKRGYLAGHVEEELLQVLGAGVRRDGRRGLFHPDNFTFGQPVYLSSIYAAAQATEGVDSVVVTRLARQRADRGDALAKGKLELGRLEIAQLQNDPSFPERGTLRLHLRGGA